MNRECSARMSATPLESNELRIPCPSGQNRDDSEAKSLFSNGIVSLWAVGS